jgi:hypothetical protein
MAMANATHAHPSSPCQRPVAPAARHLHRPVKEGESCKFRCGISPCGELLWGRSYGQDHPVLNSHHRKTNVSDRVTGDVALQRSSQRKVRNLLVIRWRGRRGRLPLDTRAAAQNLAVASSSLPKRRHSLLGFMVRLRRGGRVGWGGGVERWSCRLSQLRGGAVVGGWLGNKSACVRVKEFAMESRERVGERE